MILDEKYWSSRYVNGQTGWDIGYISDPIKAYVDQLTNKDLRILIPGGGNSYEAEYIFAQGFKNTFVVDISHIPLEAFSNRCPLFPKDQLLNMNFFDLDKKFDLVIEQTFFCSLDPKDRDHYASKMGEVLSKKGRLVGVLFNDSLFQDHPPYGGYKEDYMPHFRPYFDFDVFEECYNSIKPREGRELFINLIKKA